MRYWVASLLVAAAACGPDKPPPPPPPPPPSPPAPTAPDCVASPELCPPAPRGRVIFDEPAGWRVLDTSGITYAEATQGGAVMTVTAIPSGADIEERRRQAADGLARVVGVTPPGGKVSLSGAPTPRSVGSRSLELWEVQGAERAGTSGGLLIFAGPLDAEWTLVGIGFAPSTDATGTAAILKALETLRSP